MAEPKGMSFEREFATWMEKNLGYTYTKLRIPVKGKVADRAYEVDIYAERYSRVWEIIRRLGIYFLVIAVLTYFLPKELKGHKT